MERWKHPANYGGFSPDGDFIVCAQTRDSDCLSRSNYTRIFEDLIKKSEELGCQDLGIDGEGNESPMVYDFRAGHWAVGWVETILICSNAPDELINFAEEIESALSDYPVYDEQHYSDLEYEEVCDFWERMSTRERIHYLNDAGLNIFAARRDYLPEDDNGMLYEALRC